MEKITNWEELANNIIAHCKDLGMTPETLEAQVFGPSSVLRGYPKTIKQWSSMVHELAKEKGWWPGWPEKRERSQTELLALAICELSEGIEEIRSGKDTYYEVEGKPCGLQTEVADCIIRLLDMCQAEGWDIEEVMRKKHQFNKSRSARHGGKLL